MSDDSPLFTDDTVASAAADAGIAPDDLRTLIERHQSGMRDSPGLQKSKISAMRKISDFS